MTVEYYGHLLSQRMFHIIHEQNHCLLYIPMFSLISFINLFWAKEECDPSPHHILLHMVVFLVFYHSACIRTGLCTYSTAQFKNGKQRVAIGTN